MKKYFYLSLAALAFVACSNEGEHMVEYGQINLGIDVKNEISVNSRAAATAEELANFNLNIIQGPTFIKPSMTSI